MVASTSLHEIRIFPATEKLSSGEDVSSDEYAFIPITQATRQLHGAFLIEKTCSVLQFCKVAYSGIIWLALRHVSFTLMFTL